MDRRRPALEAQPGAPGSGAGYEGPGGPGCIRGRFEGLPQVATEIQLRQRAGKSVGEEVGNVDVDGGHGVSPVDDCVMYNLLLARQRGILMWEARFFRFFPGRGQEREYRKYVTPLNGACYSLPEV